MHLLDQQLVGIVVLLLLGMLVLIKQIATGSILEKPTGSLRVWAVNAFNLFFLLIANPLVAILLITQQHVFFYAVPVVDDATRKRYLQQAYCLGKEFARS